MKRISLSLLFLLSLVGSMMAQKYTCHIEGTTTDSETNELYLIESGADVRIQANVISIPVVDGKFSYDLKKDTILNNCLDIGIWGCEVPNAIICFVSSL